MSLSKSLAGRKKDSLVWDYFEYLESKGKSICRVVNEKSSEECNIEICGKNTTNLKRHIASFHKEVYDLIKGTEIENSASRKRLLEKLSDGSKQQSLTECINKKPRLWSPDTVEGQRINSILVRLIVDSGVPLSFVNNPVFKEYSNALDSKYHVPG